jgi:hypothetical protein
MKLLKWMGWVLATLGFAALIVLVGGTLIRFGTVTRHHHMVVTNAAEAYGGLAVVVVGFIVLIKAGANRRRRQRPPTAPINPEEAQRRGAMAFDM